MKKFMNKFLNICYWVITAVVLIVGVFGLAMTFIPAEYAQPVFEKIGISYEWCSGIAASGIVISCTFIVTKLGYSFYIRRLTMNTQKAYECVGEANKRMDTTEQLFVKTVAMLNQVMNQLSQVENNTSAMLEMEQQNAKDRLECGITSAKNKAELETALQNVMAKQQQVQALKAIDVVYEKIIEKPIDVPSESTDTNPNSGLI